ncbi:TetR/AcrR family transcriptional regulator [Streptomyces sp. DH12]|uniref:TetR/AcrR family transcriptional regulator n=1 Tax=Streptomyces sp. DH12 TaxID=2857010 RepID=UPI001E4E36F9|nr:TetR/AcrR family transcriptional regulator [Streptomyces sp. DH12]
MAGRAGTGAARYGAGAGWAEPGGPVADGVGEGRAAAGAVDGPGAPGGAEAPGGTTRERLLAAASELFAERGYERATVRDIAGRAGLNQALLFRHFGSKRALFGEVVSRDGLEQLRCTPPERLVETVLASMLDPAGGDAPDGGRAERGRAERGRAERGRAERGRAERGRAGAARSLETLLRSVGAGDEVSAAVTTLGDEYARVLATLSDTEDSRLRADLALSWLLGIGLMRVVVGKRPLADADPAEVSRLVVGALGGLLEGMPPADRGPERAARPE